MFEASNNVVSSGGRYLYGNQRFSILYHNLDIVYMYDAILWIPFMGALNDV